MFKPSKHKKLKIRVGDTVEVIAGGDKGKKGAVLVLDSSKLKVKVQGARMQTHFDRENGMSQKEGFIDYSNVKLVSSKKAATSAKEQSSPKE